MAGYPLAVVNLTLPQLPQAADTATGRHSGLKISHLFCVTEARFLWFQKWVRWGNEGSTFRLRTAGLRVSPLGWRGVVRACVEWLLLVLRGHLHRLPWSRDTHHWRHQDLRNRARDVGTAGLDPSCIRHTKSFVSFQAGRGNTALLIRCTSRSPPICMRTLMRGQIGSVWGAADPHSYTMSNTSQCQTQLSKERTGWGAALLPPDRPATLLNHRAPAPR